MKTPTLEILLARAVLDKTTGCLRWQGARMANGYGRIRVGDKQFLVHRVVEELAHGPIPDGYVVDHVHARGCRYVDCINPAHLEAVTQAENLLRGVHPNMVTARTGECKAGHRIAGKNAKLENGRYRCRECVNDRKRSTYDHSCTA